MSSYAKNLKKLQQANRMITLYAGFIPGSRDKYESAYFYRLQCKWLRKADALTARLNGMKRKRQGRMGA
ncbi:hypothetical protein SPSIL_014800 [Sporomusa silvacetica DSM 10669]|uniref:Transposase IS204/IS1001/IS1096/IS1165 DDE domain-containing protein n=1 Tax=Sporomusa silvacetica DSM 10669 TaxID=1123289 RepID=A0ABZ3IIE3_9FIRM|nr:hypothetical protein [Sporomusa silvacetica]OZC21542.1 hypothetical protein SPSIL_09530 [Sporomusa silvacetica DSM 10669]